LGNLLPTS